MYWQVALKSDSQARVMADRHYTRQTPGAPLFTPPGRTLVLKTFGAYWVTSWPYAEYVLHRWAGAWTCSAFRRETPCQALSSDLIRQAVAATLWFRSNGGNYLWNDPQPHIWAPEAGVYTSFLTFVDPNKIRAKRDYGRTSQQASTQPGRCFLKAGFVPDGTSQSGLLAFVLPDDALPEPEPPLQMGALNIAAKAELARILAQQQSTPLLPRSYVHR